MSVLSNKMEKTNQILESLKYKPTKLKNYLYINELSDLKPGTFVRAFDFTTRQMFAPCIFCDLKILPDGIFLFCKKMFNNIYFHINMEKMIVFRKLQNQEVILMQALKHYKTKT